jgi:hypothetical protein
MDGCLLPLFHNKDGEPQFNVMVDFVKEKRKLFNNMNKDEINDMILSLLKNNIQGVRNSKGDLKFTWYLDTHKSYQVGCRTSFRRVFNLTTNCLNRLSAVLRDNQYASAPPKVNMQQLSPNVQPNLTYQECKKMWLGSFDSIGE